MILRSLLWVCGVRESLNGLNGNFFTRGLPRRLALNQVPCSVFFPQSSGYCPSAAQKSGGDTQGPCSLLLSGNQTSIFHRSDIPHRQKAREGAPRVLSPCCPSGLFLMAPPPSPRDLPRRPSREPSAAGGDPGSGSPRSPARRRGSAHGHRRGAWGAGRAGAWAGLRRGGRVGGGPSAAESPPPPAGPQPRPSPSLRPVRLVRRRRRRGDRRRRGTRGGAAGRAGRADGRWQRGQRRGPLRVAAVRALPPILLQRRECDGRAPRVRSVACVPGPGAGPSGAVSVRATVGEGADAFQKPFLSVST